MSMLPTKIQPYFNNLTVLTEQNEGGCCWITFALKSITWLAFETLSVATQW